MICWSRNLTVLSRLSLSLIAAAGLTQQAFAKAQVGNTFVARCFVASEQEKNTDFSAGLVTASGSPLSVKVNNSHLPRGSYAGIELKSNGGDTNFQNISFMLSGATSTQVIVHTKARGSRDFIFKGVPASIGLKDKSAAPGFKQISLDANQLGIAAGDLVDRIVLSTDERVPQSSFTVKNIEVDGRPAAKSVEESAAFYLVQNGSPSGPKGNFGQVQALPSNPMVVTVKNSSGAMQTFFINILLPSDTTPSYPKNIELKNLNKISTTVSGPNVTAGEGVITSLTTKNGYFFLNNGDTVTLTTNPNNLTFSAQIFVNGTSSMATGGVNNYQCYTNVKPPVTGSPVQGKGQGATFAEFTINGVSPLSPDTADISAVNGVNAIWKMSFPTVPPQANSVNYPNFFCCSDYLWAKKGTAYGSTFAKLQYIPVQSIINRPGSAPPYSGDSTSPLSPLFPVSFASTGSDTYSTGTVGVYPFGCTTCTGLGGACPPTGNGYSGAVVQPENICQVSRPTPNLGGTLAIELKTFPYGN